MGAIALVGAVFLIAALLEVGPLTIALARPNWGRAGITRWSRLIGFAKIRPGRVGLCV